MHDPVAEGPAFVSPHRSDRLGRDLLDAESVAGRVGGRGAGDWLAGCLGDEAFELALLAWRQPRWRTVCPGRFFVSGAGLRISYQLPGSVRRGMAAGGLILAVAGHRQWLLAGMVAGSWWWLAGWAAACQIRAASRTIAAQYSSRYLLARGIAQKRRRVCVGRQPKVVDLPEPGVSWINLLSQRYQGPEQRPRTLLKLP